MNAFRAAAAADRAPGRYIVAFKKGVDRREVATARDEARGHGASVHFEYEHALNGFAATLPAPALTALERNPRVALIEPDSTVTASETQTQSTWGLDRIDQRALPLNSSYTYPGTGAGVTAYIIDSGIRTTHMEFEGRALYGMDTVGDGRRGQDCNGHGTHIAGTVGAKTYGVAKKVRLVSVRVLNCQGSGTTSGVLAGVDWVTKNAVKPAVANMSLGGAPSASLDVAVSNSIASGVTYVVGAGNNSQDACNYSPGRVNAAITVGSTTSTDARSWFSNYGSCVDLFAPGSSITSAWSTSDTATNTISGTSMAAPHVSGVAALVLDRNYYATPSEVRDSIANAATGNVVSNAGAGSPNRLLYAAIPSLAPAPYCPQPERFTGVLSGTGDYDYHPNESWFYAGAGWHQGCVAGPSGTDFDLYLERWDGSAWVTVASGLSTFSRETVSYNGAAGYYIWKVVSYSGSGSYEGAFKRP